MLTIHYAPGAGVSDFALEGLYQDLVIASRKQDVVFVCATENLFLRVRVGIVRSEISHENVRFRWQGQEFAPDENGRLEHWPEGFLDLRDKLLEELVSA
jgi:hypothetical protein